MSTFLRDSTPADVAAITVIYSHSVSHGLASFEYEAPDASGMARRRAGVLAGGYCHIVAERDGVLAGYAYTSAYRPRIGYRFTVENSIYVAPGLQRGGVGRALLGELISRSEAAGFRLMVAVIGDSANAASIGLHAAAGFSHAGLLPAIGWKHERWVDAVLMTRPLGEGASTPPQL